MGVGKGRKVLGVQSATAALCSALEADDTTATNAVPWRLQLQATSMTVIMLQLAQPTLSCRFVSVTWRGCSVKKLQRFGLILYITACDACAKQ